MTISDSASILAAPRLIVAPRIAALCTAALCFAALSFLPGLAGAQQVDVSGSWDIAASVSLGDQNRGESSSCDFAGTATMAQDGSSLSGGASMNLVSGGDDCPAEMSAVLTGSVDGNQAFFELTDSMLGSAGFVGSPTEGGGWTGDANVLSGPYSGFSGNFSAVRGNGSTIPTLGNLGLLALVAMLAGLGLLRVRDGKRTI